MPDSAPALVSPSVSSPVFAPTCSLGCHPGHGRRPSSQLMWARLAQTPAYQPRRAVYAHSEHALERNLPSLLIDPGSPQEIADVDPLPLGGEWQSPRSSRRSSPWAPCAWPRSAALHLVSDLRHLNHVLRVHHEHLSGFKNHGSKESASDCRAWPPASSMSRCSRSFYRALLARTT